MTLVLPHLTNDQSAIDARVPLVFASSGPLPGGLAALGPRAVSCELVPRASMASVGAAARRARARIVIFDVSDRAGWELDVQALARARGLRLVVTSGAPGADPLRAAIRAGALAFVRADATPAQWEGALAAVASRTAFVAHGHCPPGSMLPAEDAEPAPSHRRRDPDGALPFEALLTPREYEVARLVMDGFSGRNIAARLRVSVKTIETHQMNVRAKLHVASRVQQFRSMFVAWPELLMFDPNMRARTGDVARVAALVLDPVSERLAALTSRERDTLEAILRGGSRHDVAAALAISDKTFDSHLAGIRKKAGVTSTLELARLMVRLRPERLQPPVILRPAGAASGGRYAEAS